MLNKRVITLSSGDHSGRVVIYVMSRDQRVSDNHALLAAQQEAGEKSLPLIVVFNLLSRTGSRSREHFEFMVSGLKQVDKDLKKLNIQFLMMQGNPSVNITNLAEELNAESIYFDLNPLRGVRKMQKSVAASLSANCYVVDTHNIITLWVLSDKEEFAAHTIRNKVHKNLEEWLVEPVVLQKHKFSTDKAIDTLSWEKVDEYVKNIPPSNINISFASGESAARDKLRDFIDNHLGGYASSRNLPDQDGQSDLSPYLHFGQISSLRVSLELLKETSEPPLLFTKGKLASYEGEPTKQDSINALLEEMIVRKELADNYCFYNSNYDNLKGAKPWALKTLEDHVDDDRDYVYAREDWEMARTHDAAWNAAQSQMMKTGKMHGYMRMYWAKKILEWTKDPEEAIDISVYLNDKYSIDGGDPNGYTGIMWSIAGVHDRPWFDRDVYGKIRYMNAEGLKRKFDIESYILQWTKT